MKKILNIAGGVLTIGFLVLVSLAIVASLLWPILSLAAAVQRWWLL